MPVDANGFFELEGMSAAQLAKHGTDVNSPNFAVFVAREGSGEVPPLLGTYSIQNDRLRFQPRYPLTPGVRYRVVIAQAAEPLVFELPRPAPKPAAFVEAVYPTRDKLPENQLKFYIHFSAPMSRGEAYEHIQLLNASGKPIEAAFLELGEELWDPAGRRFTLFFDPGRIKRGLKPREDLGPILEAGKSYTLVIDRQWSDADGNPLKETYRKSFTAGSPDNEPIDPKQWKLDTPPAGTSTPLTVTFPEPLDHALLHRLLWVVGPAGERLPGTIKVSEGETRWQFTPDRAWTAGPHRLVIDTTLEDLAGHRVGEPFEVDEFKPIQAQVRPRTVEIAFSVAAPAR